MERQQRADSDFHAETDADTVVNMTNHAYWNLDGADAGSIFDHEMKLKASHWLPTDETQIPTGEIAPVAELLWTSLRSRKSGGISVRIRGSQDRQRL